MAQNGERRKHPPVSRFSPPRIVAGMLRRVLSLDRRLIGEPLARPGRRAALAIAVGLAALAADFVIVWYLGGHVTHLRVIAPLIALVIYLWIGRGDRRSIGLRLAPEPGWRYWAAMLGVTVVSVALVIAVIGTYAYYKLYTNEGTRVYLL